MRLFINDACQDWRGLSHRAHCCQKYQVYWRDYVECSIHSPKWFATLSSVRHFLVLPLSHCPLHAWVRKWEHVFAIQNDWNGWTLNWTIGCLKSAAFIMTSRGSSSWAPSRTKLAATATAWLFRCVLNEHANELLMPALYTLWLAPKTYQTAHFVCKRLEQQHNTTQQLRMLLLLPQPLITSQVSKFNLFPFSRLSERGREKEVVARVHAVQ